MERRGGGDRRGMLRARRVQQGRKGKERQEDAGIGGEAYRVQTFLQFL